MSRDVSLEEAKRLRDQKRAEDAAAAKAERQRQRAGRDTKAKGDSEATARPRFAGKRWVEITYDSSTDEWLVQGLLPLVGLAVFYGRKKLFKSFIVLSLGAAIAARRKEWAGRAIKRYGAVIYIAGEGGGGMHKRIAALKQVHADLDDDLPFILIPARPNLGIAKGDVAELLASIRALLVEGDGPPVLVVVDTLVRTLHGTDENGEGMRNFADNAEQMADELKCLVIAVHHQGAGDGMRGHTSLPGASVANWHIEPMTNGERYQGRVVIEDSKDGESGLVLIATLRQHFFGDPEKDPDCASTLLVDKIEPADPSDTGSTGAKDKRPRVARSLSAFMTAVSIALDQHGTMVRLPDGGPQVKAVREQYLRNIYYFKRADLDSTDSKSKDYRRQLAKAVKEEALVSGTIDGTAMVWLPSKQALQAHQAAVRERAAASTEPDDSGLMAALNTVLTRFGMFVRLVDGTEVKAVRAGFLDIAFDHQLAEAVARGSVVTGEIDGRAMIWLPSKT
jgi:hypothetical protein